MRNNDDDFAAEAPKGRGEPIWADQSRKLATGWLTSFGQAIQALNRGGLDRLFHCQAVVFGAVPNGCGPCSEFDALQFGMIVKSAKIAPLDRYYILITVEWIVRPVLPESPTAHGDATFVLYATNPRYDEGGALLAKGCVQCVHAHYSRRAAVEMKPSIIKP